MVIAWSLLATILVYGLVLIIHAIRIERMRETLREDAALWQTIQDKLLRCEQRLDERRAPTYHASEYGLSFRAPREKKRARRVPR